MKHQLNGSEFLLLAVTLVAAGTRPAHAGVCYSIDFQGAEIGWPAFGPLWLLTEGDIIHVPYPEPGVITFVGTEVAVASSPNPAFPDLGLPIPPALPMPGVASGVEVDALSHGDDYRLVDWDKWLDQLSFSVDEFAIGGGSVLEHSQTKCSVAPCGRRPYGLDVRRRGQAPTLQLD